MIKGEFDLFKDEADKTELLREAKKKEIEAHDGKYYLVLIVDDDSSVRDSLGYALENDYQLIFSSSGEEGIEAVNEEVSAVVLDIKMQGKDGFQTFIEIKKKFPNLPIIFHSAYQDLKDPYEVMNDYRPFGYISKEGEAKKLNDTISSAVDYYKHIQLNEKLVKELLYLNANLERKVDERTFEIQEAKEILEKQNSERKELLHVLCHDLVNPISCSKGFLELLEEEYVKSDNSSSYFPFIASGLNNCMNIIELTRNSMALEEEKLKPLLEPVILNDVIKRSNLTLTGKLEKKGIKLEIEIHERQKIITERISLENSVINNLLTNAIKFSYPGSAIFIKAEQKEEVVELRIKDMGIGIPDKLIKILFNPAKKTHRTGTNGEGGTGFGMPLVKKYMLSYGGNIRVVSTPEKKGLEKQGTEVILTFKAPLSENLCGI